MWEVEGHYQPKVDGRVGTIHPPIFHRDAERFAAWIARHNRYSDWAARMEDGDRLPDLVATETGLRRRLKRIVARLPARPLLAFLDSYAWCLGFLDGRAGIHYAMARAVYYWMIDVKRATDAEARRR
jgi:hypothetical protein